MARYKLGGPGKKFHPVLSEIWDSPEHRT
jgi:hypothetical protein